MRPTTEYANNGGRGLATSMINSWTILGNLCLKVPYSTWKNYLNYINFCPSPPFYNSGGPSSRTGRHFHNYFKFFTRVPTSITDWGHDLLTKNYVQPPPPQANKPQTGDCNKKLY